MGTNLAKLVLKRFFQHLRMLVSDPKSCTGFKWVWPLHQQYFQF